MKPIAIIQHVSLDGPEYFLDYLNRQAIPSCIFKVYAGAVLPDDVSAYAGIATFGGPMSVNDEAEHDWILPEIDFLRRAVAAGVPVIGHCLGGQLLARALGARVRKADIPEIGWVALQAESERWRRSGLAGIRPRVFFSGTATVSTCRQGPVCWPAVPIAATRLICTTAATWACSFIAR
ncbi:type 1 glutamine amidotransferase [Aquitalea magnusonii]|uniref:type 1 glutamine amidotransferase n=1 Tax=Aquitalea magnusonii TaxID=332411 RepID=UPI0007501C2D|nr:type 1 glutamine amidotransferase [Aquitalea magnusonii]